MAEQGRFHWRASLPNTQVKMKDLYTYVLEFDGDTMIRQSEAENENTAVIQIAMIMGAEMGEEWRREIGMDEPVLITGMNNVWYIGALISGKLLSCHFVRTKI